MSDDPSTEYDPVLRPILEALNGIDTRLESLEGEIDGLGARWALLEADMADLKSDMASVKDSLQTIRATMTDMRDRQNGMAADIQNIYHRIRDRQPMATAE